MTDPNFPAPPPAYPGAAVPPASAPLFPAPSRESSLPLPLAFPGTPQPPQPPTGAYAAPVGGYAAPAPASIVPTPATRTRPYGTISLVLALIASVGGTIALGILTYIIGAQSGAALTQYTAPPTDLAWLSSSRDLVLAAEITFWLSTALGVAAIVLGIIAIAKRQRRGAGIAGVIVACAGPVLVAIVVGVTVTAGLGSSALSVL